MLNENLVDFGIFNVLAGERFHVDLEPGILKLNLAELKHSVDKTEGARMRVSQIRPSPLYDAFPHIEPESAATGCA
jgi:hypothetical protein